MTNWEIRYDAILGSLCLNILDYSVKSGNDFTSESIPDNADLSDHRKARAISVSINAMFVGEGYEDRFDKLKTLEGSDDTYTFYVRSKHGSTKREVIYNCAIESVNKKVGNEDNCIFCSISLKEIKKGTITKAITKYEKIESPIIEKSETSKNVFLEEYSPNEIEKERAKSILSPEIWQEIYGGVANETDSL